MQARIYGALLLTVLAACTGETQQTRAGAQDSTIPRYLTATCEGEGCIPDDSAMACRRVQLRAAPRTNAAVVGELRAGDTVASRSDLHLVAPGIVILRRDIPRPDFVYDEGGVPLESLPPSFTRGDTLLLLYYQGEGYWRAWHRQRTFTVTEFWAGPAYATLGGATESADSSTAVAYSHPKIDAWFELTHRDGRHGWWLEDSVHSVLSLSSMSKWGMTCAP